MNLTKQNKIASVLRKQNNIKFACFFGSALKNKRRYGSDIDIAVYFENDPGIHDIGELVLNLDDEISFKKFKRSVLLQYLDFKFVRDMFEAAFNRRLSTNKFAVFDK